MNAAPDGAKTMLHGQLLVSISPPLGRVMTSMSPVAFGSGRLSSPAPAVAKSLSATVHGPLVVLDWKLSVNPRLSEHGPPVAALKLGRPMLNFIVVPVLPAKMDEVHVITIEGTVDGTEITTMAEW